MGHPIQALLIERSYQRWGLQIFLNRYSCDFNQALVLLKNGSPIINETTMMYLRLLTLTSLFSFLLMVEITSAQTPITLSGMVMDAETGDALSFATVALSSRSAGALTDTLGRFSFRATPIAGDSLQVTYVGYSSQSFVLNGKPEQIFHIKLSARLTHSF